DVASAVEENGVAQLQFMREIYLTSIVITGQEPLNQRATLRDCIRARRARESAHQSRRRVGVCRFERRCYREAARNESLTRIEADVVHRARHRFETDDRRALGFEPLDTTSDDFLSSPATLELRAHGKWSHPAFRTRPMDHVERDDLAAIVAPEH